MGQRRRAVAAFAISHGHGGQKLAAELSGMSLKTIRKGCLEIETGLSIPDDLSSRGRKCAEYHLPNLLDDIAEIIMPHTLTDPTFQTPRIYTPLTARHVRERLICEFNYPDRLLPTVRTIRTKMNEMGFRPMTVRKSKPLKKLPETDEIFDTVHAVNKVADEEPGVLRISLDTKAAVPVGPFSRGGKNRQHSTALDHDFAPEQTLTPFGIFVPKTGENYFTFCESRVTADCMVDCLEHTWPDLVRRHGAIHTLVINADNGPECSGRRKRWLERLAQFSTMMKVTIQLAYYPPYHSKYNPIERVWGVLENHWRGELLTGVEKILGLARSMTYRGLKPNTVRLVKQVYKKGVSLVETTRKELEKRLSRKDGLENYFITIVPVMN